jgi:hypothetical protein
MEFSGLEGSEDQKELHHFFCCEYFGYHVDVFGRKIPNRTTSKNENGEKIPLNVIEAMAFYAYLQRRGAEVGCQVPDPDPFWREKLKEAKREAANSEG